jgi:hypothetical protein
VTALAAVRDGNAVIQAGFDPAAAGAAKALGVEESGLFVVLALIAAGEPLSREIAVRRIQAYGYPDLLNKEGDRSCPQ